MKRFKHVGLLILAIMVSSILLESCKKGEMDPGLSFKSRKARMAGDYNVDRSQLSGEEKYVKKAGSCITTATATIDSEYDGEVEIEVRTTKFVNEGCGPDADTTWTVVETDTSTREVDISFTKDGKFTWKEKITPDETSIANLETVVNGTWNFLAGVGELKNKEGIVLNPTEVVINDTDDQGTITTTKSEFVTSESSIYTIKQLKSDEIILVQMEGETEPTGDYWENTLEMTLRAK